MMRSGRCSGGPITTAAPPSRLCLATPGVPTPGREYPSEFYYKIQVTPWFDFRPDLQYIVHPGGYANVRNETIIGFKTDIKF